ncbi:MAG: formylglycine-generating enzyme family protein [Anaerolineae bacterium]|nr:formylglycine-generating enzyme family protein [Anaerolineae bacterium]
MAAIAIITATIIFLVVLKITSSIRKEVIRPLNARSSQRAGWAGIAILICVALVAGWFLGNRMEWPLRLKWPPELPELHFQRLLPYIVLSIAIIIAGLTLNAIFTNRNKRQSSYLSNPYRKQQISIWVWAGTISSIMVLAGGVQLLMQQTLAPIVTPTPTPILINGQEITTTMQSTTTTTSTLPALGDTWTRPTDEALMVYVPAGEFAMGRAEEDIAIAISQCELDQGDGDCQSSRFENQTPQHRVILDGFWIDETEVTNAQFTRFLNAMGNQEEAGTPWLNLEEGYSQISAEDGEYQVVSGYETHPVIEVTWYGATAYCEWAGGRLPTESEWEYAARGPDNTSYPWGKEFDCSYGNFDDEAEIDSYVISNQPGCDGYNQTAPVKSFPEGKSWCNAQDMAGNVWEWVQDWYAADAYQYAAAKSPTGPRTGEYRVGRGGSWWSNQTWSHSAMRLQIAPDGAGYDLGFRCVVENLPTAN